MACSHLAWGIPCAWDMELLFETEVEKATTLVAMLSGLTLQQQAADALAGMSTCCFRACWRSRLHVDAC